MFKTNCDFVRSEVWKSETGNNRPISYSSGIRLRCIAVASKKWKFANELMKIGDQKLIWFDSVRSNHLDTTRHKLTMKEKEVIYDFGLKDADIKNLKTKTDNIAKSNKCSQCDFASSQAGNLKRHLKTHSGEKSNKCNQCDYASSQISNLRIHLKTHSGEKSNKCKPM